MKRVVIADDLEDQRALYVASLALAGFAVDEAADGGQVFDVVTDHRPDVIVLDLAMPVLDGLEVCRRLKANHDTAAIPIIIVTGNTLPGVREAAQRAGADAFLARPCPPATLVAAIQQRAGENASSARPAPYPAEDVPGGDSSREIEILRPAQAADVPVDLAGPSSRPRRPRHTMWLCAIAATVVLAVGITLGLSPIGSMPRGTRLNGIAEASVDQHQKLAQGLMPPAIAGVSPRAAEEWFRQRFGFKVAIPDLEDARVRLVGARMSRLADADAAVIDYELEEHRISLFIIAKEAYNRLALGESPRFKLVRRRGYDVIIWRHGAAGYALVSKVGVRACHVCHSDEKFNGASLTSFVHRF
jgi:CheY-like chemotaxis protein/anti-sigma factor RsiW